MCIDRFTRRVEAYPMTDQTTESVIHALNQHIQAFGTCCNIHTYSGCQFTSTTFRDYCKLIGANHRTSSVRYPKSYGLAERSIKNIKISLTAKLDKIHWTCHLPFIMLSLNSMYKEDLKCSSSELVHGQTLRLPGDLCANKANSYAEEVSAGEMISSLKSFASQC